MVKVLPVVSGIVVVLVILVGVLFVFGDDVLRTFSDKKVSEGGLNFKEIVNVEGVDGLEEVGVGGGGSDVGENIFEKFLGGSNCKTQQIQYSLRNFQENVMCIEPGIGECVGLVVSCSMEIYSFESDFSGVFGIRYSLVDSDKNEMDFRLVEREVGFDMPVIFSAEFVRSDMQGVDEDLSCPFTVEKVPLKEICN